jgi:hypothetical protein
MPIDAVLLLAGALGAVAKDVVKDNKLILPKYENGELFLGCIGGMLVGAFVGWVADNNPLTACLAGYVGVSAIEHLLPSLKSSSSFPLKKNKGTTSPL